MATAIAAGLGLGFLVHWLLTKGRKLGRPARFGARWVASFVGYLAGFSIGVALGGPEIWSSHRRLARDAPMTVTDAFVVSAIIATLIAVSLTFFQRGTATGEWESGAPEA